MYTNHLRNVGLLLFCHLDNFVARNKKTDQEPAHSHAPPSSPMCFRHFKGDSSDRHGTEAAAGTRCGVHGD